MQRYALLLLPGFDGTGLLFKPLLRVLPAHCTPIVVSYPPDTPLSYEDSVHFAAQYIPKDMPCVVVGESYSGPIALQLAVQYSSVAAVVLCATFVTPPIPAWCLHLATTLPLSALCASLPRWLLRWLLTEPTTAPELLNLLQQSIRIPHTAVLRQRLHNIATADNRQALQQCRLPILALVGTADTFIAPMYWQALATQHLHLRTLALPAPHLLLQTHPQEAVAALEVFVQQCIGNPQSG